MSSFNKIYKKLSDVLNESSGITIDMDQLADIIKKYNVPNGTTARDAYEFLSDLGMMTEDEIEEVGALFSEFFEDYQQQMEKALSKEFNQKIKLDKAYLTVMGPRKDIDSYYVKI